MTTERANTITVFTNVAVVIAVVGAVWALGDRLGRLEAGMENNAAAIAKLQDAVVENGKAIERLAGQFAEHIRRHQVPASL